MHLPHQRCLSKEEKLKAAKLLEMKANKKIVQQHLLHCNCMLTFRKSMSLPCRHMLKLRKKLGEPLYHADICDRRWTIAYYKTTQNYKTTQRLFSSSTIDPAVVTTMSKNHKHKHSQHEKFRKASLLTAELASISSEASGIHYCRRIEVLKDLIEHWKRMMK